MPVPGFQLDVELSVTDKRIKILRRDGEYYIGNPAGSGIAAKLAAIGASKGTGVPS